MESIFVVVAVIGFMEFVKALFAREWQKATTIAGAIAIGAIAGYYAVDGLTLTTGVIAGLSASGTYRVGRLMGGTE